MLDSTMDTGGVYIGITQRGIVMYLIWADLGTVMHKPVGCAIHGLRLEGKRPTDIVITEAELRKEVAHCRGKRHLADEIYRMRRYIYKIVGNVRIGGNIILLRNK